MAVAGIDRWRGGWIIASVHGTELQLWSEATITPVIDQLSDHEAVAIDMPIALATHGRRTAESEVRQALGASARSVFTSPTRAAVVATSQAEATIVNREHGGPGISAQAFGLFASIVELRSELARPDMTHWYETHPETSFALMNGGPPLASKRTAAGIGQRLALLRENYATIDDVLAHAPAKVPADDVLDAVAAAWSAGRIAANTATLFGPAGRDDEGFAEGIRI